ncbi:hypothetical protein RJ55_07437 [Drechmeria coniospora]|nr:hypothetical protein RJ55_07437 [Drechmeria coniospora]
MGHEMENEFRRIISSLDKNHRLGLSPTDPSLSPRSSIEQLHEGTEKDRLRTIYQGLQFLHSSQPPRFWQCLERFRVEALKIHEQFNLHQSEGSRSSNAYVAERKELQRCLFNILFAEPSTASSSNKAKRSSDDFGKSNFKRPRNRSTDEPPKRRQKNFHHVILFKVFRKSILIKLSIVVFSVKDVERHRQIAERADKLHNRDNR